MSVAHVSVEDLSFVYTMSDISLVHLPEETDFSRYSIARSWLWKLLLWLWWSQPSCWRTLEWLGSRSNTRWYAPLALSNYKAPVRTRYISSTSTSGRTYVFLLFVDMADLEPNVLLRKGVRRRRDNIFEALEQVSTHSYTMLYYTGPSYLQALIVLLLLLVYYPEPEIDLVRLFEVGLHLHDLGEGLLRVIVGSESVVEDTDAVPEFGFLKTQLATCYRRGQRHR